MGKVMRTEEGRERITEGDKGVLKKVNTKKGFPAGRKGWDCTSRFFALVAATSGETFPASLNSEMSDFSKIILSKNGITLIFVHVVSFICWPFM